LRGPEVAQSTFQLLSAPVPKTSSHGEISRVGEGTSFEGRPARAFARSILTGKSDGSKRDGVWEERG